MNHQRKILRLLIPLVFVLYSCGERMAGENRTPDSEVNWIRIGPGGGGSTFIPTFSYGTSDRFVLRCDMTGSYITQDGGKSFHQANFANGAAQYAFDPSDDKKIYVAAEGLFRSVDGGKKWTRLFPKKEWIASSSFRGDHANFNLILTDSIPSTKGSIKNISIDPNDPDVIRFTLDNVFYFTHDSGNTWSHVTVRSPVEYLWDDEESGVIVLFARERIYKFNKIDKRIDDYPLPKEMIPAYSFSAGTSQKNGAPVYYALHRDTIHSLDEAYPTDVYVSYDKGVKWEKVTAPMITNAPHQKPSYSRIACALKDSDKVYLVTDQYVQEDSSQPSRFWYGTLHSSDNGKNWDWVWKGGGGSGQYGVKDGKGVTNLNDAWVEQAFGGEYIRLIDVGVYPVDGNVAIVTDWYRAMKTMDGGRTWAEIYSETQPDGTYRSRGIDVTTAYGVHRDPFNADHLAISYTDIGFHHSSNNGKSWARSTSGVPDTWQNTCYWVLFDPKKKDKLWSVWSSMHDIPRGKMTRSPRWKEYAKGGVCVSENGGVQWAPASNGLPDAPTTSIVLDPRSPVDTRTLYVSVYGRGVYKSIDGGKTWIEKNSGLGDNRSAFELTCTPEGTLYLVVSATPMHKGNKKGTQYWPGALYKSIDGAETWQELKISDGALFPSGLAFDPEKPNRLYLACWSDIMLSDLVGGDVTRAAGSNPQISMDGGVFTSEDGGTTWQQLFDRNLYVYDVTVHPTQPSTVYINTFNQAAYGSNDFGKTWNKIKGYDFHWGHRVLVDELDDNNVFITTFGSSVWYGKPNFEKDSE